MTWAYDQSDPALMLFTAAIERFNLTFPPHSRILELGCAESDWLDRMHRADSTLELTGVDARRHFRDVVGYTVIEGDAMNPDLFEPESFDRIVILGALEHFGLGFYGDPVCEHGDMVTMDNVARWLKPGGLVYFDVPCQPTFRVSENRHFRMYAPGGIGLRLVSGIQPHDTVTLANHGPAPRPLVEVNRAYSLPEPHAGTWCHEPTVDLVPYWFCAVLATKVIP